MIGDDDLPRAGEWWRKARTDSRILFAEVVELGPIPDEPRVPGDPPLAEVRFFSDEIRADADYSAKFTDPARARAVLTARGFRRVA